MIMIMIKFNNDKDNDNDDTTYMYKQIFKILIDMHSTVVLGGFSSCPILVFMREILHHPSSH